MSSLAIMLKKMGYKVCGSDEKFNRSIELLVEESIKVIQGTDNQEMPRLNGLFPPLVFFTTCCCQPFISACNY